MHRFYLKLLAQNLMTGVKKNKEPYSTLKAWGGKFPNMKEEYWRKMAQHFRKENKELKKEIANLKEEDKDSYIESVLKK